MRTRVVNIKSIKNVSGVSRNSYRIFGYLRFPGVYAVLRRASSSRYGGSYHCHWHPVLLRGSCMEEEAQNSTEYVR